MKLGRVGDRLVGTPLGRGAGLTMSLVRADGIMRVPPMSEGLGAGDSVSIKLLRPISEIENTVVEEDITTFDADIRLDNRSRVEGDIIIRRSPDDHGRHRQVRIEITGGSVVMGDILNRDENVDVRVYLSDGGRVEGRVRDVEIIRR